MPLVNKKASMAELVDAADSKSALSNRVLVQVRLEVPKNSPSDLGRFFFLTSSACAGSINTPSESAKIRNLSNSEMQIFLKSITYLSSSPTGTQKILYYFMLKPNVDEMN